MRACTLDTRGVAARSRAWPRSRVRSFPAAITRAAARPVAQHADLAHPPLCAVVTPAQAARRPQAPPLASWVVAAVASALLALSSPGSALSAEDGTQHAPPPPPSSSSTAPSRVAAFPASGLVFKDTVEVVALPDPAVSGVVIYVTEVKRSLVDKLSGGAGGFFAEPAAASVTCVAAGGAPATLVPGADVGGPEGRDIFAERKSLSLVAAKTLRVRRVVDRDNNTVLYLAYNTRLASPGGGDASSTDGAGGGQGSSRYRTSVCALPLGSG